MQRFAGVMILCLGIGWLAAPYLHIYYRVFNAVDTQMPIVGLFLVLVGLSLLVTTIQRSDLKNRRSGRDSFSPPPYHTPDRSARR